MIELYKEITIRTNQDLQNIKQSVFDGYLWKKKHKSLDGGFTTFEWNIINNIDDIKIEDDYEYKCVGQRLYFITETQIDDDDNEYDIIKGVYKSIFELYNAWETLLKQADYELSVFYTEGKAQSDWIPCTKDFKELYKKYKTETEEYQLYLKLKEKYE